MRDIWPETVLIDSVELTGVTARPLVVQIVHQQDVLVVAMLLIGNTRSVKLLLAIITY